MDRLTAVPMRRGRLVVAVAAAMLVLLAWLLREPVAVAVGVLAERVGELGGWGPVAYGAALTVAIPVGLPAAPFLLAAGILFGPVAGVVYAALGNLLGGAVAFLLGRRLLRARVERRLAGETGLAVMNRALRQEGARGVALIRLSPALPAWLINYALGVSRTSWRDYWLSSISILPTVLLYVLSGVGIGDLATLERGEGAPQGTAHYVLLGAGILATLAASLLLGRRARRILAEMED